MSQGRTIMVTAGATDAGERLDRYLARALAHLDPPPTRSRIKSLIEAGMVTHAGATIGEPARAVKPGQVFSLYLPEAVAATPEAQALALPILYEDAELLVLDKPAGLVVHPAPGNPDHTLVNALLAHCGESLTGIGGVKRPGIVHRLDKDTSGLMVVAKTEAAHQSLTQQFAARSIERHYLALVWGRPLPPVGEIVGNIGRNPKDRKKMALVKTGGKAAVTRYRLLKTYAEGAASLIECRLLTGRTHQIRVHLTAKGHPLLGDPVYGKATPQRLKALPAAAQALLKSFKRQALHAASLGFLHPISGECLRFEAPMPSDHSALALSLETL